MTDAGLGRAHHRLMYCLDRYPGITVGDLRGLLRISTQSLARTTQPLLAARLVEQRLDEDDRRLRRHYLTEAGGISLADWCRAQHAWVDAALADCPPGDIDAFWRVMERLVTPEDLEWIDGRD